MTGSMMPRRLAAMRPAAARFLLPMPLAMRPIMLAIICAVPPLAWLRSKPRDAPQPLPTNPLHRKP
ncbi:protein of unknown function [Methylocella tundrae]|uniref:Uncharacterized protein n=1 Tax=Methylocella tundrae TaxID=227605 RepID=A0A4U8Z2W7_METTU|nr:protein of unknown function [Methylocella tundrae]